jgi:hypothetical protein
VSISGEGSGATLSADDAEAASSEGARVYDWRYDQLLGLGFGDIEADLMASWPEVDLGRVRDLIRTGCPMELVVRIVV